MFYFNLDIRLNRFDSIDSIERRYKIKEKTKKEMSKEHTMNETGVLYKNRNIKELKLCTTKLSK